MWPGAQEVELLVKDLAALDRVRARGPRAVELQIRLVLRIQLALTESRLEKESGLGKRNRERAGTLCDPLEKRRERLERLVGANEGIVEHLVKEEHHEVVLQILAHAWKLFDKGDGVLLELFAIANAGQEQELRARNAAA